MANAVQSAVHGREDIRLIGTPDDAVAKLQKPAETGTMEASLLSRSWACEQLDLIAREVMPAI